MGVEHVCLNNGGEKNAIRRSINFPLSERERERERERRREKEEANKQGAK